eukprot:2230573-Amphidinium_carterae.1
MSPRIVTFLASVPLFKQQLPKSELPKVARDLTAQMAILAETQVSMWLGGFILRTLSEAVQTILGIPTFILFSQYAFMQSQKESGLDRVDIGRLLVMRP